MTKKRLAWVLAGIFALLIVAPVIATQLGPDADRQLAGVTDDQVDFTEVRFDNVDQGIELAGMLFVPEGAGPFPAVVLIHGSGTSSRKNRWYLTVAHSLQHQGIAVLLPDKRGSEHSEGDWRTSSLEDLATDTVAAVAFLKQQDEVPISRIGIVGMSQGGHIAPLVASRAEDVAFVVNVVGSALPLRKSLVYEETRHLRELGVLPGIADLIARCSTLYLINIGQRKFWQAIGDFDPLPYWDQLKVPALVLYGSDDQNVNSAENASKLRSLGRPNIQVTVYQGSGHALSDPVGQGDQLFRQDALDQITEMIKSLQSTTIQGS